MKNLLRKTMWVAVVAAGVPVALAPTLGATPAKPHTPALKQGKAARAATKSLAAIRRGTASADATVYPPIPGTETMTPAQAQESVSAAQAGQQALRAGNLGAAEAAFRLSTNIEKGAANEGAILGLAQTLEREGKNAQSIRVYRYLLYPKQGWQTSEEQNPILRMHLALLLAGDKQWAEAVSIYESTIGGVSYGEDFPALDVHFRPNAPQPALFRAMAHLVMGVTHKGHADGVQALAEYAAAVRADPSLALAHYYHGQGLLTLGRRVEARAAFEQANELDDKGDVRQAAEKELRR